MTDLIYHRHRIIPGHMGGTIEIADYRTKLTAYYTKNMDIGRTKFAWHLSGQIGKDDFIRAINEEVNKNKTISEEHKAIISATHKET